MFGPITDYIVNCSNVDLCIIYMYFTSICDSIFHKFHHQSSSQFTPQVLSSSQGNILEDEAAVQVSRIVE